MTAETDLLPLVGTLRAMPEHVQGVVQSYARANIAHATAPLQAEIETLLAELDIRDSIIATHAADTREYQKRISQAEARADKLAEALREAADDLERGIDARIVVAQLRARADLLRDQEVGNG